MCTCMCLFICVFIWIIIPDDVNGSVAEERFRTSLAWQEPISGGSLGSPARPDACWKETCGIKQQRKLHDSC